MFDYLQQFNKLPKELRDKISQKEVMSKVNELENKYHVDLAALVMKVMVRQIPYESIALFLVGEKGLNEEKAEELSKKLKETVFKDVSNYLDADKDKQEYSNKDNVLNKSDIGEIKENKKVDKREDEKVDKKKDNREDPQELIDQINKKEDHNIKIDKVVEEIIDKGDVSLSSSYLYDRLHMVLRTYIKGVRDKISTRSTLTRSGQEGGLSLDDASIDKLLKLADKYKKSQEPEIEKPKPKVSEEAEKIDKLESLNESYNLKDSLKLQEKEHNKKKEQDGEELKKIEEDDKNNNKENIENKDNKDKDKEDLYKKLHIKREIAPPTPSTIVNKERKYFENENKNQEDKKIQEDKNGEKELNIKDKNIDKSKEDSQKKVTDEKKKNLEINNEKQKDLNSDFQDKSHKNKESSLNNLSQAPISAGKKSMQDIKVNQRIMGPIDELRYFNLKNFRRLSPDPQKAFSKIKDKIDILAKQSYEKRIEGIQAWKENPLNKLYHQISRESLNQSKPIIEIIKQRQDNDVEYLSNEELKALVSFNRAHMF